MARVIRYKKTLSFLAFMLVFGVWYSLQTPRVDREWSVDQQILPYAELEDGRVRVFNIRNFSYQSAKQYTPDYYHKTFSLDDLQSLYYIVEPLGGMGAAHTFLSFGFTTGEYVAISVEIRKETGETFSPLKGLLRQYELMYVVADERDVIDLRANHRNNTVYLYPAHVSKEHIQTLFVDMLTRANTLRDAPEFYNTLTSTCTTNIASHINRIAPKKVPWDIRLLLPRYSDALAYELGLLDNSLSLSELRAQHMINEKAAQYANSPNFSQMIRGE